MPKTFFALSLMSSRFPMGVDTIYKPAFSLFIILTYLFIVSCSPVNDYLNKEANLEKDAAKSTTDLLVEPIAQKSKKINKSPEFKNRTSNEIEIILPDFVNPEITNSLINAFELSVYKKEITNISLNINKYDTLNDLDKILSLKIKPGKIFVGTLNSEAAKVVKKNCDKGIIFFSFAADKNLANDCVYLVNFFPEDDLTALFNFFPEDSKITLLFPENYYGYNINNIIDPIASKSNALLINRASYKEDLTNAREAIKELGKYELRKYELNRQKKILKQTNDEASLAALEKIKKFETIGEVDFTHIILPDYSIRLLEIAPLLPFYDVDPDKVQFVGTGVWDDEVFFDEPSLQGAIFSGIEESKRKDFFDDYEYVYKEKPIRTATIPYDLTGIISYIIDKKMNIEEVYNFLDNGEIKFDGIDGKFYFVNKIIFRELDILQIFDGEAKKLF